MKKLSLIAALTLSTMLSACGGGGGGGHSFVPPTTLPDNPSNPGDVTNACAANPETCMTSQSFSNAERRIELYQNAENQASTLSQASTFSARGMLRAAARNSETDSVTTAYNNMHNFLIEGNLSSVADETLLKSLLLAGFNKDDLPTTGLKDWVKINSIMIKNKAQKIWDMYGVEKDVDMKNANLAFVNIEATQDSYVNFIVDDSGKITGIHYDIDTKSSSSRAMDFVKKSDNYFERKGASYVIEFPVTGRTLEIELVEDITADNIEMLKKRLIAKRYEKNDKNNLAEDLELINALTFEKFEEMKAQYQQNPENSRFTYNGGEGITKLTYKSYGKQIGEKGLQYSDFGYNTLNGKNPDGSTFENTFVFAGGYDVKKIDKVNLSGKMTFKGDAVATVLYQKEHERREDRKEENAVYTGTSELEFNNGNEVLTANFADWYNVQVASNGGNYNIELTGGNNIANDKFKFNDDDLKKENFIGTHPDGRGGKYYGAVDFGYYGDNADPTEATGYIAYGTSKPDGIDGADTLHAQIAFGAVK